MKQNRKLTTAVSLLIFLGAFCVIQYYIWGNAFITEYQSDCTDTLLWAQSSLESGKLFKPSFNYAYRLAFGGQWLFMPFLKLFGVGMTALRAGMSLFTVLFSAALIFFFRSLGHNTRKSLFESAVMLLACAATRKTREIFFGHIIHYSLSVFYLLLAFSLLHRFLKAGSKAQTTGSGIGFAVILFLCSANGTVEILYVTLPMLAGCAVEFYLNRDRKLLYAIGCLLLAGCAGFLFSKSLNTNYSDSYSVLVPDGAWAENLANFPKRWISLFYQLPGRNLDSFSSLWLKTVFKTIIALAMLVGLVLSFSRYKTFPQPEERVYIFTVWSMFAALLFFFVFGKISDVDWRLIPLVFVCETLVLVLFNTWTLDERTFSAGMILLCEAALALHAASNGLSVLRISYDKKIWFAEDGLIETLKAHDLEDGFISSYWLSNSVTVLTDNQIRPRMVSIDQGHIYLNPFNSDLEWYDTLPDADRYFLVLRNDEITPEVEAELNSSEKYYITQEDTRNYRKDDYTIFVLNHNIMQEEHDNLLPRYR